VSCGERPGGIIGARQQGRPALKPLIRAEISAAALRGNLARVRAIAPRSRVLAVVKANAYGHGLLATARTLADAGADALGVARLEEALQLRESGVTRPMVLMEGVLDAEGFAAAARHGLELVVHCEEQLLLLERAPEAQRFTVWLKIDTGMNRLGFRATQVPAVLARLDALGAKIIELRLMTHFSSADDRSSHGTAEQLARFTQLTRGRNEARSLANSAAVFDYPKTHAEWVRPGLALYGASPFAGQNGAALGLAPAMRLVSTVIGIRGVPAGETVGYGAVWRAQRDSRIAVVAAGYADGVLRSLPGGAPVLVNGMEAPLAGRVSMDMIAVDVTEHPAVLVGDPAVLWGPELPVEQVAAAAGTIGYELLCAVAERVPRVMV
jgi:alanine racemase